MDRRVFQIRIQRVPGGPVTVEAVEVSLDWDTVAATMGRRAVVNKNGRCVRGPIVVKHLRTVKEEPKP